MNADHFKITNADGATGVASVIADLAMRSPVTAASPATQGLGLSRNADNPILNTPRSSGLGHLLHRPLAEVARRCWPE